MNVRRKREQLNELDNEKSKEFWLRNKIPRSKKHTYAKERKIRQLIAEGNQATNIHRNENSSIKNRGYYYAPTAPQICL